MRFLLEIKPNQHGASLYREVIADTGRNAIKAHHNKYGHEGMIAVVWRFDS